MHLGGLGMKLNKHKLGSLLSLCDDINEKLVFDLTHVRGISVNKHFITTKANMEGVSLKPYLIVKPNEFAYVTVTSRNGEKISIARNDSNKTYICSSSYNVFKVNDIDKILPEYLSMLFERAEFDRYARYHSWGSARETFDWQTFCEYEIELPPISIQQRYIDIYNALLQNQQCYESGLNDLKLTCDAYIENLRHSMVSEEIGNYIVRKNDKNIDNKIKTVLGLSTSKEFRVPQSRVNKKNLGGYKIVKPFEFAFVPTTDTWKVLAFAINTYNEPIVVSPIYEVFSVCAEKLLPEYLALWLSREEFDRYARFHSWGSARENFSWDAMCEVLIPIPDIEVQKSIVDIYKAFNSRKEINEKLKAQLKDICPILIKGSIEEAKK